jgi:hypothetical protein
MVRPKDADLLERVVIPPALQSGDHDEPAAISESARLHEVGRLMLFQKMDASDACHRVGALSASQFSRDYGRFFGNATGKDIARLREDGYAPADGGR